MPKPSTLERFESFREEARVEWQTRLSGARSVAIGMATCGIAAGAQETMKAILEEVRSREIDAYVTSVGCAGMCAKEPLVDVRLPGQERIAYGNVHPDMVPRIIEEHVVGSRAVSEWALGEYADIPFYGKQKRLVLANCGVINPERIEDYVAQGGYEALAKALGSMSREDVIEEVKRSGLRGRGGAGFITGLKWEFTYRAPSDVKYIVCNADEGDPGAFMDRSVIEGDPHSLLEGMILAAYAIGAGEGYIYCRAEYPLAIHRLKVAIAQAEQRGLLGDGILGSDFSFHLKVKEGAGAFVCGEETALLASIEGLRGEPRPRPPYPAVKGLWGKPTNINNVKSYANVPRIIVNGADWFSSIGMPRSSGTAIFALTGKVNNTGLIEVPMGIKMGDIVFDIGGGIPDGKRFKAVQTGGPLGGCLPVQHLNLPVDFDSLRDVGAVIGSGGMIVVDEDTCMVEFSRFFLTFATAESCGKCVPCRVGGRRMLEVLIRITEGHGKLADIETIKDIAAGMESGALCALGQLTPGPVLAALRYFEDEFIEHIVDKKFRAGSCQALTRARCTNACPAGVDVPSYVSLVAQGRYAEALDVHRLRNPFALVCGRVCPAFCEDRCRRDDIDEPVAIRAAKRFMADHEIEQPWTPAVLEPAKAERVAVVGSGPAGLTAALRLAQKGYGVTVFEKLPIPGGMMAVGIPEYRLQRDTLNVEIQNVERAGVEVRCNQALGTDFTVGSLLNEEGYSAVVLAIGAHLSRRLAIEGEDLDGVYHGVSFLRDIALGYPPDMLGKRVAIVGGGDVAIDVARSAWRLGASEVHVIYRRTREDMPAHKEEIAAAEAEGTVFHFLANPLRAVGKDGKVTGIVVQRQSLGEFDTSGRRRPTADEGSDTELGVDVLVPAIGQAVDLSCIVGAEIDADLGSTFTVNGALTTSRAAVFAAGDAVTGPATVIEAVAQGNQVAVQVDHYLRTGKTDQLPTIPGYEVVDQPFDLDEYADALRPPMPELPVAKRQGNFEEVEMGMDEIAIRDECKRCLRCDLEWLETQQLAFEPMPERVLVDDTAY
ncbi:MAG TPA: FAD-dependent oxidoreductase [Anaerolineae bacterium]|nr:FAD-dependent oxidoreductase [Anaerolineae bacterium]